MNHFIVKILDYELSSKKGLTELQKGVDAAMGGKILELESERIEKVSNIKLLYTRFGYTAEQISEFLNIPLKEVKKIINSFDKKSK